MPYRKGIIRQHGSELSLFHRVFDGALILVALWMCGKGYGVSLGQHYQLGGLVAVFGFFFFAEWYALYGSWRSDSVARETWSIISIWILACCVMFAMAFLSKASINFSRVVILAWMISTPLMLVVERVLLRFVLRRFRYHGLNSRSAVIVGKGRSASQLADTINSAPWMGLKIVGIYDDVDTPNAEQNANSSRQDIETLVKRVREGCIDCVYIAFSMQHENKIRQLVEQLADSTASVYVVPDVPVSDLFHARWSSLGSVPVVSVFESPIYGSNLLLKRLEDVILGGIILMLISPLLLVIAAAVKLSSPGRVIFKQRRYGLNGQVIEVWKFRSMSVTEDGAHVPQAQKNDPRVTPLGGFLRRTSLDELPQFINVLQGRMSIVGPRPHAVSHNEQYRKLIHGYMLRHTVKPGITGWAQVNGWRGETDTMEKMEKRVECDLYYINNWSLFMDIKIIVMTVFGGMRGKNAY